MLGVQLAPYLARHRAAFDFVFADAPRAATGEPEDGIPPEVRTYEWWGEPGVPYDDAWKAGFGAHPNPNPNPNQVLWPASAMRDDLINKADGFAQVMPTDKHEVVAVLQKQGKVTLTQP